MCEHGSTAHERCGSPAHKCAVAIKADTLCHFRDIPFVEALIGAKLARFSTPGTGLNTRSKLFVGHNHLSVENNAFGKNKHEMNVQASYPIGCLFPSSKVYISKTDCLKVNFLAIGFLQSKLPLVASLWKTNKL
jgi:hypothetical protein